MSISAMKQEPVAWVYLDLWLSGKFWPDDVFAEGPNLPEMTPLYTAPPRREWVGLTDGEIYKRRIAIHYLRSRGYIWNYQNVEHFDVKEEQPHLKEKNT